MRVQDPIKLVIDSNRTKKKKVFLGKEYALRY